VSGQKINPGSSVGLDLAALYKSNPFQVANRNASFNAGLNLSNIGPGMQYTDNAQKDPLPTVFRLGWAYTMDLDDMGMNTLTFTNDISKIMARTERTVDENGDETYEPMGVGKALFNSWGSLERATGQGETISLNLPQQLMWGFGLEYWYNDLFALRTGYYYENPDAEMVTDLLAVLLENVTFVIVDMPGVLNESFKAVMGRADMALHVVSPDVVSLQTAVNTNRTLAQAGIKPRSKSHILNQTMPTATLSSSAVERGLNARFAFHIDYDRNQPRAMTQGVPLTLTPAQTALPSVVRRMADVLWQRVTAEK
ncbi:MAG: PorV/PorQ family protein, partial [Chloroflexota bacterium]